MTKTTTTIRRARLLAPAAAAMALLFAAPARADSGEELFKECASCHSLKAGDNEVGPSLHGVFGRQAGTGEGFRYSNIFKAQKFVWTEELLDRYISDPQAMLRGSKMPYSGMSDAENRKALIAWLTEATK